MPKMKTFRYWFHAQGTGFVDIQALNQEQADDMFNEIPDGELLHEIESVTFDTDDMEEIKN